MGESRELALLTLTSADASVVPAREGDRAGHSYPSGPRQPWSLPSPPEFGRGVGPAPASVRSYWPCPRVAAFRDGYLYSRARVDNLSLTSTLTGPMTRTRGIAQAQSLVLIP